MKNGHAGEEKYRTIDIRSDTVSKPTPEMMQAMMEVSEEPPALQLKSVPLTLCFSNLQAVVGDDVYEEDATIKLFEQEFAKTMGKEASLFVPTGTMGNLIGSK